MRKFWLVALHEYTRHVFRRRFLFALLSLPAFLGMTAFIMFLAVRTELSNLPVGVVHAERLIQKMPDPDPAGAELPDSFIVYPDEVQAESDLQSGRIQGYYLLAPDFTQTGNVTLISAQPVSVFMQNAFSEQVRHRLLAGQPPQVVDRLTQGARLVVRSADGQRAFTPEDLPNLFIPLGLLFVFMLAIFSTSGYLMQAVTEEKENRTMEIVLTSLSSGQLMGGKIVGSLGVGFTQLILWLGVMAAAVWAGIRVFGWEDQIRLSPGVLGVAGLALILSFLIVAAMMAAVGSVVTEATEGQQITGPFSLPFIAAFLFIFQVISEPNSPLALALSFIPFTSPVILTLRLSLISVPAWQTALSLIILALTAAISLWLAGRLFRLGMLQYRLHFNWRQVLPGRTKQARG